MDWNYIASYFADAYPDEGFWSWLKQNFPEGFSQEHMGTDVKSAMGKWYNEYQQGAQVAGEFTPFKPEEPFWGLPTGLSEYEEPYARQYMNIVKNALDRDIGTGDPPLTQEIANHILGELRRALLEGGLDNATLDALEKEYELREVGEPIRQQFGQYLGTGQTINLEGQNYKYLGGIFYDTSGKRIQSQLQGWLTEQLQSQEALKEGASEAELQAKLANIPHALQPIMLKGKQQFIPSDEKAAWDKYRGQRDWWEKEGSERVVSEPSGPGMWTPKVAIAENATQAFRQGMPFWIDSNVFYSPEGQKIYGEEMMKAMQAQGVPLIGAGQPGEPHEATQGYNTWADVLKNMSESQRNLIRQAALQNTANKLGGAQPVATPTELRQASKQGEDVGDISAEIRKYNMAQLGQDRGSEGPHISVYNRQLRQQEAQKKRQQDKWGELLKRALEKQRKVSI